MTVWKLMTRDMQTCRTIDTLECTAELMRDHVMARRQSSTRARTSWG